MLATRSPRRSLLMVALVAGSALFAGCDDDPVEPPPEEEPTFNRVEFTLTAGGTTRVDTVTTTGAQNGNRTFPAGTTTVMITNTRFLRADGTVDPVVTTADFELRQGTGGTAGVTFTRTAGQSFQGTIAGLTDGTRSVMIELLHKEEGHADFAQLLTLQIGP
jgi:hypothetical protein